MVPLRALSLCLAAAAAVAAAPTHAQQPDDPRPAGSAQRTVALFDFEERTPGPGGEFNPDPVPRHWFRAHDGPERDRPGFPAWNSAAFDDAVSASGTSSVRLGVSGGSASLRLMPGTIPVFPGADYAVAALVRTDGLDHARAFVTARLLDASRKPIAASQASSEPVDSPGAWTKVLFEVRGDHPGAAFLQLDLELLQPREFAAAAQGGLGRHAVLHEDIDARAWFDDVAVFQIPRITLECQGKGGPAGIVLAPDRPELRFGVRDMVGDALSAALIIEDDRGERIAAATADGDASGRTSAWTPDLPGYGWYRATLTVTHHRETIARASTQFLWLPPVPRDRPIDAAPPSELRRWGLVADAAPPEGSGVPAWPPLAADVARAIGTGFIVLPHADPSLPPAALARSLPGEGGAEAALETLLALRQDVGLCFAAVPHRLAADLRIDPADTPALGVRDAGNWLPYLAPVLERTAGRITRWQIGPVAGARSWGMGGAAGAADLAAAIAGYRGALQGPVPGLRLGAAVIAGRDGVTDPGFVSSLGADDLLVCFPAGARPQAVAATLTAAAGSPATEVTIVFGAPALDSGAPGGSSVRAALDDLVRAAAEVAAAPAGDGERPAPRAAIAAPWLWSDTAAGWSAGADAARPVSRAQALPQPHLAVWRTIMDHLAGRTPIAELAVGSEDGVRCIVLGDPESEATASRPLRGAILAWSDPAGGGDAVLRAYLGEGPLTIVDIFGNESPVPAPGPGGRVEIPIPGSPIFIEGIDPRIVRFIASLRVDPPFARAVVAEHEHALVLDNPWPIRVSGQLQIVSPDPDSAEGAGWTVSPRGVVPFSIAPGSSERIPVSFSFGAAEESGRKRFEVLVKLVADRAYPAQLLTAPLDIGSDDLTLVCEAARAPDERGPDVTVTATVTNRGKRPRSMSLDAVAPGLPSQQFPIGDLAPGETTTRRFVFRGAAKALAGRRIRLSLTDTDVSERLNTSVVAPE